MQEMVIIYDSWNEEYDTMTSEEWKGLKEIDTDNRYDFFATAKEEMDIQEYLYDVLITTNFATEKAREKELFELYCIDCVAFATLCNELGIDIQSHCGKAIFNSWVQAMRLIHEVYTI